MVGWLAVRLVSWPPLLLLLPCTPLPQPLLRPCRAHQPPRASPAPCCCAAAASRAEASRTSSAFGGAQFWAALRGVANLETEVRGLFTEAKTSIRRRGGMPLLVESDLQLARFLAGLHVSVVL